MNDDNRIDETECFARIGSNYCNVLNEKKCKGCKFFKPKSEIKNNPYYAYSYDTPEQHAKDVERYKINPEDIVF